MKPPASKQAKSAATPAALANEPSHGGGAKGHAAGKAHKVALPRLLASFPALVRGARAHYEKNTTDAQARELIAQHKRGQQPKIFCVSCSDSRVNVPMLFDLNLGQVFEHRNMGNLLPRDRSSQGIVDTSLLATIEYAINVLKVDLLLVLGHTGCGLVKAVMDRARADGKLPLPPHVAAWADHAGELQTRVGEHYEGLSTEQEDLAAVGENVLRQLDRLRSLPVVREALSSGAIDGVLGAVYEVTNHGVISWWDDDQQCFIATQGETSLPVRQAEVEATATKRRDS